MQITMRSTDQMVELVVTGVNVTARVWTGTTANGIPVKVLVTGIAVRGDADCSEFEADLKEQPALGLFSPAGKATAIESGLQIRIDTALGIES